MLKASNSKNLVNEAYLVVEDGYEKAPSEHLKYPHHKLKGNELIVDEAGVIAAFQRTSQQGIVSGALKAHLLKHYRELGLSTENFEEKEGQAEMVKKVEEEKLKKEKESTKNISAEDKKEDIKKETAEDKKEDIKEKTAEDKKVDMEKCEDMKKMEDDCDDKENKPNDEVVDNKDNDKDDNDNDLDNNKEVDYESKIAEYESKIAEMEKEKNTYMEELEELRKYKAEREEADKNFAIEEVFAEISEVMPEDKMEELREEAKNIEFSAIDGFKNKVKAIAFEYTTNKDVKSNRMAIVNIESQMARKPFDWYKE